MAATNRKKRAAGSWIVGWAIFANLICILTVYVESLAPLKLLYTSIYIGICIGWGVSVSRRIVQRTVRRYMVSISVLSVIWFVTRSIKYYFTNDPVLIRHLWYFYYVPMLFIPLCAVLVAMSLGKPEDYRLSKRTWLLLIPAVLSLLVMTNDFHQLAFTFPEGSSWSDSDYSYGKIYYLIWASEVVCALVAFVIMLGKCRTAGRRRYLPVVLILLAVAYSGLYVIFTGHELFEILVGDMVMVYSLLFIGILESTIACGLIQTNSGYEELFSVGTIGAQIADHAYQIRYTSKNAPKLSKETLQEAQNGSIFLDKNTLLKGQPIAGGQVFWQEDITRLTAVLEKMERTRAAIAQNNHIEEENLRVQREIHTLREKNRLYDMLQAKVAPQIELLNRLFAQYNCEADEEEKRKLLGRIAVVGAYIKRLGNLLFIGERSNDIDTAELSLCMEESFFSLTLMDIECAMDIPSGHHIATRDAIYLYDIFERIAEAAMESLHSVWLKARIQKDGILFLLQVECEASLLAFSKYTQRCVHEDGVWRFALRVGKAGEMV